MGILLWFSYCGSISLFYEEKIGSDVTGGTKFCWKVKLEAIDPFIGMVQNRVTLRKRMAAKEHKEHKRRKGE